GSSRSPAPGGFRVAAKRRKRGEVDLHKGGSEGAPPDPSDAQVKFSPRGVRPQN
ncbi:unnamed protein product, partial [Musa textilis]